MRLKIPNVLLLSADQTETAQFQSILGCHVRLTPIAELSELTALLEKSDYDALFCAGSFQKGTWMDVLEDVRECHPGLPVIVLSPAPEVQEWTEVLEAGAFDWLVSPHQEHSVLAVLEQASASFQAMGAHISESLIKMDA